MEDTTITGAQALIEQGKQLGREEGREEGRKVLRSNLLKLLGLRFGPLPQHIPVTLEAMSMEALTSLFDQAVAAENLADLQLDSEP